MTDPDTPRDAHPRLDIADAYADDVTDIITEAVKASPTTAVRVYYPKDTDASADIVTLDDDGNLVVVDPGVE